MYRDKYSLNDWNSAKVEAREAMIARAKVRGTIPYIDLIQRINTIRFDIEDIDDRNALATMLGEISTEEDENGRGMLSVVVVHKQGDMQPGPGFFDLAEELGRDTSDILVCWIDELKRVHRIWSLT
jgi:hypothetical protein